MKSQDGSRKTPRRSIAGLAKELQDSLTTTEQLFQHVIELTQKDPDCVREELSSDFKDMILHAGAVTVHDMLKLEVAERCGERYKRGSNGSREYRRIGVERSSLKICGQSVPFTKPRVRYKDKEYQLKTHMLIKDLLKKTCEGQIANHVALGSALNKFGKNVTLIKDGKLFPEHLAYQFFKKWKKKAEELMNSRDLSKDRYVAVFVDTIYFGGHGIECAFGINDKGEKRWLGMTPSSVEKSEVVSQLLRKLVERGLSKKESLLFIIDGSKAIRKGIVDVFGDKAVFQRCYLHKLRNIQAYLSKNHGSEVRKIWKEALESSESKAQAEEKLDSIEEKLSSWKIDPMKRQKAIYSLREGRKDLLTLFDLDILPEHRKSFLSTNLYENAVSLIKRATRHVLNWHGKNQPIGWACVTALNSEKQSFTPFKNFEALRCLDQALQKRDRALRVAEFTVAA